MIAQLPHEVRRVFEQHGIENDSLTRKDHRLFVQLDDLEVGFEMRSAILDVLPCCLIAEPQTQQPILQITLFPANIRKVLNGTYRTTGGKTFKQP
jgi:hypothetical protein